MTPADAIRTTDGAIALFNLDTHIEGLERHAATARLTSPVGSGLVDLLLLRGQIRGRIADYERAVELAERLTADEAADGAAFLARARTRAGLHRFGEALADLDVARRLGVSGAEADVVLVATLQAVGRYDEALVMRRAAAAQRRSFETVAGMAVLHAERGEVTEAEQLFAESRVRFRGVSPFELAQLDFQHGHMWIEQGDLQQARDWLMAAWRRLPAYAPAEGHLAEIEAALGEPERAIRRLRRLANASDDPDYADQLARILGQVGHRDEAVRWRAKATLRYDQLVVRHPAAFADHAAEFCLLVGDPQRALHLARLNADNRPTSRARSLLARALERSSL